MWQAQILYMSANAFFPWKHVWYIQYTVLDILDPLSPSISLDLFCLIFSCCADQVECGGLQRSYRRAPRSAKEGKDASVMAGICHLCLAGYGEGGNEWEDLSLHQSWTTFYVIVYIDCGFLWLPFFKKNTHIWYMYDPTWPWKHIQHGPAKENWREIDLPILWRASSWAMGWREPLDAKFDDWDGAAGKTQVFQSGHMACSAHGSCKRLHQFSAVPCTSAFRWFKRWQPFPAHDDVVQRLVQKKQEDQVLDQTDKGYSRRLWKAWRTCCGLEQSCSQYNFDGVHWLLVWPLQGAMWARWASTYGGFLTYVNFTQIYGWFGISMSKKMCWPMFVFGSFLLIYIHEPAEHMGNWRQVQQGLWINLCLASIMLICGSLAWTLLASWNMASTSWRHTAI